MLKILELYPNYIVLLVTLAIWTGMILFLAQIERRLRKLEHSFAERTQTEISEEGTRDKTT